jgi:hypothetical protein
MPKPAAIAMAILISGPLHNPELHIPICSISFDLVSQRREYRIFQEILFPAVKKVSPKRLPAKCLHRSCFHEP